ncbi:uncharacterized protein LOC108906350 [Anoplophora glabripennis]|uniref:uncharacterized protein LOC108906350 n=1 Tax=Anoplophora glabripennis TaxID=217634 RepID=UPI00087588A6|nr:uncharacterized protein LOC108906350 [Anoplophora glabripennis]
MISVMMSQKLCASGRLLKSNFKHKILQSFSYVNIRNINSIKRELIFKSKSFYVPKRNFYRLFRRETKEQLKIKDEVPDQYTLIYRSTMDRYILYAQIITTFTALIAIVTTIVKHDFSNPQLDFSEFRTHPREVDNEIYVYMTAFITIVVILQVMISRLPIRIYNLPQQKKYIFVFHGNYPFSKRKLVCKIGDVVPLPETGVLPWKDGRYLIKNEQKLILVDRYFRRPADLYIMLGVQRDPDVDENE